MRDQQRVMAMLDAIKDHRHHTRAPDFMDGVIDALEWVLSDTDEDIPPTMLAYHWITGEPNKDKEKQ